MRIPLPFPPSFSSPSDSADPRFSKSSSVNLEPSRPTQCASKHAILGLSRSLAKEYAPEKVRVNVVAPGPIETPYLQSVLDSLGGGEGEQVLDAVPMRRYGQPEEVARAIAFLLSKEASYITVSLEDCSSHFSTFFFLLSPPLRFRSYLPHPTLH